MLRLLRCDEALEALQDALDERLAPEARPLALDAHLADCAACRREAQALLAIDRAGRGLAARWSADAPDWRRAGRALAWVPVAASVVVACGLAAAPAGGEPPSAGATSGAGATCGGALAQGAAGPARGALAATASDPALASELERRAALARALGLDGSAVAAAADPSATARA